MVKTQKTVKKSASKAVKKVISKAKPVSKKVVKAKSVSNGGRKSGDPSSYMNGPAVLHYDIDWSISFRRQEIAGTAILRLAKHKAKSITLDITKDLIVESVIGHAAGSKY